MKRIQGILMVSFGTTYRDTREKNIERLAETVRECFPDWELYQAYSSGIVRRILKTRDHISVPGIREALHQMHQEQVTHVSVLPTYIIDGIENNKMKQILEECSGLFAEIRTAGALLSREEDIVLTAEAIWEEIKDNAGEDPVIFMGHGSAHEADQCYQSLEKALRTCSGKEIYIATVEGSDTISSVMERLRASKVKKGRVLLLPLMLVAGDHATNDMAGDEASFAGILRAEGYEPEYMLKGLGEYKGIRRIYVEHLRKMIG